MRGLYSTSALSLLGVNIAFIVLAIGQHWSLPTILASYLAQSVIIGLFQARKMWDLEIFSTEGLKMNGAYVEPTPATRRKVVLFFLLHYGLFHAAYAGFISIAGAPYWPDVILSSLMFFGNHLYSYIVNRRRVPKRIPNIGTMMFAPYIRIVPMHVFIVAGALAAEPGWAMLIFLGLKTLADEAMHAVEHRSDMQVG